MSLDVYLTVIQSTEVFWASITHNLNRMAEEAGVYKHLWRPEELGLTHAKELIDPLRQAIAKMEKNPDQFRKFDAPNGWGTYPDLLRFLRNYLAACIENPDAVIRASR